MRWRAFIGSGSLALAGVAAPTAAGPLQVQPRGSVVLAETVAVDQAGASFPIGGMSGVAYQGPASVDRTGVVDHRFLIVQDNSDTAVRVLVRFSEDGSIARAVVESGLRLGLNRDHEGVAFAGANASVALVSEESTPAVREYDASVGTALGVLPLPDAFASIRPNFGLEAVASRTPPIGETTVWTANEEALSIDGPISSPNAGTWVRLQKFRGRAGAWSADGQRAYRVEPMHGGAITGGRSGLVELVALPDGRVLGLERSFAFNLGGLFRSRLYELDLAASTEVGSISSLEAALFTPVGKRLLWQGGNENLEGLSLGPVLADGSRAMLGVVDNGDPLSQNRLIAFRLAGVVEPAAADVNWDSCVDLLDLIDFLSAWIAELGSGVAAGAAADVDGDSAVTLLDLLTFLNAWIADVGSCGP